MKNQVMPKVNGKRFYCDCGIGIFTVDDNEPDIFVCNGCGSEYQGAPPNTVCTGLATPDSDGGLAQNASR